VYFWRIDALKDQLRKGPLPTRDAFNYYLPFLIVMLLSGIPHGRAQAKPYDLLMYAGQGASYAIIFWLAYIANGAAAGIDFLPRFFSLSWVRGVRLVVRVLLPFLLIGIFVLKPLALIWARQHAQFVLDNRAAIPAWGAWIGSLVGMVLGIAFFVIPLLKDLRSVSGRGS
jgi:hypothetical protein